MTVSMRVQMRMPPSSTKPSPVAKISHSSTMSWRATHSSMLKTPQPMRKLATKVRPEGSGPGPRTADHKSSTPPSVSAQTTK